jgi:hypothetical protein
MQANTAQSPPITGHQSIELNIDGDGVLYANGMTIINSVFVP